MDKTKNKRITITYICSFVTLFMFLFSQYVTNGYMGELARKLDNAKVKFIFLFITCIMNLFVITYNNKGKKLFPDGKFRFEFDNYFKAILILIFITLVFQFKNGFKLFAVNEALYLLTPLFFTVLLISVDSFNITRIIDALFYGILIIFLLQNISNLSFKTLISINFLNSYSPFESGLSGTMVFFTLYFLVRNERRKSIICTIVSYITLKRISVLICIALIVFWPLIKKLQNNKKLISTITKISIIIFVLLPFGLEFFYSDTMADILSDKFQINMNQLTMDRYRRTRLVLDNKESIVYGLGSTTEYITQNLSNGSDLANRNLHSDILKLYLECTIIGSMAVTYYYFKSTKNNIFSFILIFNVFIDMIFNHNFLGAGNSGIWCIIYMIIFYLNNNETFEFYQKEKKGKKNDRSLYKIFS